jgi:secreted PhoX family phosphatase
MQGRHGLRSVSIGLMLVILGALAAGASGCGGSSGGGPSGNGGQALWVPNRSGDFVAEFTSKMLKKSGTPGPAGVNLSSALEEPWGEVFDSKKNLWVSNVHNGTLTLFTFAQLKALGKTNNPTPVVVISGLDRPEGLVFDEDGNMWVANEGDGTLLEFTPAQLATSGSPTPNITISSGDLDSPVGLALNNEGGLWVADDDNDSVMLFTAAQLSAGGSQTPTVLLTSNGSGSLDAPEPLRFDKKGNLWVANNDDPTLDLGTVVAFSPSQLSASGSPTPIITITSVTVGATNSLDDPAGLAFDKKGNLWVANVDSDNHGSLAQYTSKQLAAGGALTPNVFLDSDAAGDNIDEPFLITFGPSIKF